MTIQDAMKETTLMRVSHSNGKWLVTGDELDGTYTVYGRKHGMRKTRILVLNVEESEAVKVLMEDW